MDEHASAPQGNSSVEFPGGFAVVFLICVVLVSAKCPDALRNPQFWAEDGAVFYAEQFGHRWPLLFTPYAGYLHFIPRLIAWLALGVQPVHVPLVYNLSAIIIQALCIAYSVKRMSPLYGRVVALLAFFLTPTMGDQFGTITNIQWISQFALIFGVLSSGLDRPYRLGDGAAAALVLVASLTGPFSVIHAIFLTFLWLFASVGRSHAYLQRFADPVGRIVSGVEPTRLVALFLGAAAQLVTMATNSIRTPTELYTLTGKERELLGLTNLNSEYLRILWNWHSLEQRMVGVVYTIIFILALVVALRQVRVETSLNMLLLSIGAVQPFIAYFKQQHMPYTLSAINHYSYFFGVIAYCCAMTMLLSIRIRHRLVLIGSAAACLILFFVRYPNFLIRPSLNDLNWSSYAANIAAGERNVVVPINPDWRAVFNAD